MLGIASEPDDDANVASQPRQQQQRSKQGNQQQPAASQPGAKPVTDAQRKAIYATSKSIGMDDADVKALIKKSFNVEGASKLTVKQASNLIDMLNQAKTEARPA